MSASMQNWLLINPNTSSAVTARLWQRVQAQLPADVACHCSTARFGAPYIASEASYAVAAHAVLDAWHQFDQVRPQEAVQGYLVGCFGDPGVAALREVTGRPVIGLAEAAFAEAARHGRFAIVTGGACWESMLRKVALIQGYGPQLVGIHTLTASGAELTAQPEKAAQLLHHACRAVLEQCAADAVILGGAGLTGLADGWADQLPCPLIDSVDAGVREMVRCAHDEEAGYRASMRVQPHPDLLRWPREEGTATAGGEG